MTKHVLIVEDEELTAGLLKQTIDALEGFSATIVDCKEDVVRECAQSPFRYDCALFDVEIYEESAPRPQNAKPSRDWGIETLPILGKVIGREKIIILTHFSSMIREKLDAMGYGDRVYSKDCHSKKIEKALKLIAA